MSREPDCAWALLVVGLISCALFFWTVVAHPTAQERSRMYDSIGGSTGVNWR